MADLEAERAALERGRKSLGRAERQDERLGTRKPECVYCGENDRRCLEKHHPFGRTNADRWEWACANCHRKHSDMQQDWPETVLRHGPKSGRKLHTAQALHVADALRLIREKAAGLENDLRQLATDLHRGGKETAS